MNPISRDEERKLMTELFETTSYVQDYAGQPLPDVEDEDEDGDPREASTISK